jgi:hypothetical protein
MLVQSASFRDQNGFLFYHNEDLYRCICETYRTNYELLVSSGLYSNLVSTNMLLKHEENVVLPNEELKNCSKINNCNVYKVVKPKLLSFISYPYEWCFDQLKDAALLTLEIASKALTYGMILKDASAYNVQFENNTPIFIDLLSFEEYQEGSPWIAYKQFCQHFLAPLALMSYTDIKLSCLLKEHIDGIPLKLAIELLPLKARCSYLLLHLFWHSAQQDKYQDQSNRKIKKYF